MGLLDGLENQALGSLLGGSSNPLATGLLQMIQNQPGGLQGLVFGRGSIARYCSHGARVGGQADWRPGKGCGGLLSG